ncbi:hypothetical protein ABES33_19425 [Bacillus pseudomycoides]|uniref:hypothetical protein n=1 Tax=Bacillus pseudomycoides TaxID=64104 RepID=UPI003D1E14EB
MYFLPYNYCYNQSINYDYSRANHHKVYTTSIPIYINGENINNPPYIALNYHPNSVQQPVVYVPITLFSKVGATVHWDEPTQVISVGTDEFLEDKLIALKARVMAYEELRRAVGMLGYRYNGMVDGKFVFSGTWWDISDPNADKTSIANTLTVGKHYTGFMDLPTFTIINDHGEEIEFRRSYHSLVAEGIAAFLP